MKILQFYDYLKNTSKRKVVIVIVLKISYLQGKIKDKSKMMLTMIPMII